MTDPKGSPDFGEPWEEADAASWLVYPDMPMGRRAIACVNALAGIADPEAWVREARELLGEADGRLPRWSDNPADSALRDRIRAFLARSTPPAQDADGERGGRGAAPTTEATEK